MAEHDGEAMLLMRGSSANVEVAQRRKTQHNIMLPDGLVPVAEAT